MAKSACLYNRLFSPKNWHDEKLGYQMVSVARRNVCWRCLEPIVDFFPTH
jgi:hypothetical protein